MKKFFLVLLLLPAIHGLSQKIKNNLAFQKGQKLEMTLTLNSSSASMGNTTLDMTLVRSFDVEDVSNGNAVIEHKVKRIKFDLVSMMGNESFDSEKEGDRKGKTGKALEKSLKNKYSMTLDPAGKITSVKKDDDNPGEIASDDMVATMLTQIAKGISAPAVGDRSDFAILPDHEVGVGDSWSDSVAGKSTTYTLDSITPNEVVIRFTETEKIERKQEMMGQEINISTTENTTGTIRLDKTTGLLKEKTATTDSQGVMSAMGQNIPVQTTIQKNWIVK